MNKAAPFHLSADGNLMALGDGPELYAYSGRTNGGIWRQFCDGVLVGVAAINGKIAAVDADGRLIVFRAIDGSRQGDTRFDRPCHGMASAPDGRLALLVDGAVIVCNDSGENAFTLPAPGVSCAAFGKDLLAIGSENGTVQVVDLSTKKQVGQASPGGPVTAVAFRAPDEWCVGANRQVQVWSRDLKKTEATVDLGGDPLRLACSAEGALAAVLVDTEIRVFELYNTKQAATVTLEREVNDIAFGGGHTLGIGLDDVEANRVDLMSGNLAKTDPFPGRAGNKWAIRLERNEVALRQAVAFVKAGGKPIAQQVNQAPSGGGGCFGIVGVVLGITVLLFGCTGCIGSFIFYYTVYAPQY